MVQTFYQDRLSTKKSVLGERPRPNGAVAYESETLKRLKIDSGGIFNKIDDATSNIIRLLSNRCVLESLTVRSRMKPDFGEQILKLSKNTKLRLVDLTQIVVVKIIQDRFSDLRIEDLKSKVSLPVIILNFRFEIEKRIPMRI